MPFIWRILQVVQNRQIKRPPTFPRTVRHLITCFNYRAVLVLVHRPISRQSQCNNESEFDSQQQRLHQQAGMIDSSVAATEQQHQLTGDSGEQAVQGQL